MPDSREQPTVVVVLTALNLEYEAVRAQLTESEVRRHQTGTVFEVGRLPGTSWRVALAVTGAGSQRAAVLAERSIAMFNPVALLMVGVAGALADDLELGDVVVATRVHAYHGGIDDDSGFHARPRGVDASHRLEQLARHVARNRTGQPRVHFRPIAAGDVVLNSRNTPLARQLQHAYNDAAAIEMESAGAAEAAELNHLPVLTVRGISDRADGGKVTCDSDGWQPVAAENAARFAAALIAELCAATPAPQNVTGPGPQSIVRTVIAYHERPSQYDKALLVDAAEDDVIDLGTALNTCSGYLVTTERPAHYRRAVIDLLRRGGRLRCFLLDPDSKAAETVGRERREDLPAKIRRSLDRLRRFREAHPSEARHLEIHLTPSFAGVAALGIDLHRPHGTLLYSPYLRPAGQDVTHIDRGDMPHYLLSPSAGQLFTTMAALVGSACRGAAELPLEDGHSGATRERVRGDALPTTARRA